VRVFKLYAGWATDVATRSQLRRVITDLRRRGIALAVETPALTGTDACGGDIEGVRSS
jgi:hypothetical protein